MHTECSHCQTVFNVTAEQLRVAHGIVRCGRCLNTFDAIETLSDGEVEELEVPELNAPAVEAHGDRDVFKREQARSDWTFADTTPNEAERSAADADRQTSADDETDARHDADDLIDAGPMLDPNRLDELDDTGTTPKIPSTSEMMSTDTSEAIAPLQDIVPAYPDDDDETTSHDVSEASDDDALTGQQSVELAADEQLSHDTGEEPQQASAQDDETSSVIPQVLHEDITRLKSARKKARHKWLYALLSVIALVGLGVQYLLFMPEDARVRYPMSRPLVERICGFTDCELVSQRAPESIAVMSRDVRVHPRYEGALQVSASLVNEANFTQPYPRVLFTLFNVNGQTIAARAFDPHEYLPSDAKSEQGMAPGTPTQIELEVLAPDEAAVSFEFTFY